MSEYLIQDKTDMTSDGKYFTTTAKQTIFEYVIARLDVPTPIRIQKTIYDLYAQYEKTYGQIGKGTENQKYIDYPKHLFKPNFRAYQSGPRDNDIQKMIANDMQHMLGSKITTTEKLNDQTLNINGSTTWNKYRNDEIIHFMNQVIEHNNELTDYELVEQFKLDESWKQKFLACVDYKYGNYIYENKPFKGYNMTIKAMQEYYSSNE